MLSVAWPSVPGLSSYITLPTSSVMKHVLSVIVVIATGHGRDRPSEIRRDVEVDKTSPFGADSGRAEWGTADIMALLEILSNNSMIMG